MIFRSWLKSVSLAFLKLLIKYSSRFSAYFRFMKKIRRGFAHRR